MSKDDEKTVCTSDEKNSKVSNARMLTARELANELGISFWAIWRWTKEGKMPNIRINKRIYYRVSSVERWLSEIERLSVEHDGGGEIYGVLRRVE